jgi:polyphosphate kinase
MSSPAWASVGDHGVLNAKLPDTLSDVWIDRDLRWLDFNQRVLAEALDDRTPLLERAKFLAIFTSNLDEFFMKRMAVLRHGGNQAQRTLVQQLRTKLLPMLRDQADCYRNAVVPGLEINGILLRRWDALTLEQSNEASTFFDSNISAAVTPLVIDPEHPFPFLSNLSTSLVFRLEDPESGDSMYARIKVPGVLKSWVTLNNNGDAGLRVLIPLYEVIRITSPSHGIVISKPLYLPGPLRKRTPADTHAHE